MITQDITQRWRQGRSTYRPAEEVIDPERYDVELMADDASAKAFVTRHHYSGTFPAARFRVGLFERGAARRRRVLVGVAVFSHPCNELALRPLPTTRESVELGRFVLLDRVPGNGETWFLARAFSLIAREGITGVVAFSDPFPRTTAGGATVFGGHVGTIYQAHNAVYLGRARADTIRLLPDGRTLHARAIAISLATGSQWNHEALYRTRSGNWILRAWSQWQGSGESWAEISKEDAARWFVDNELEPARTECDRLVVDKDGFHWKAMPKHTDVYVETRELKYELLLGKKG